MTDSVKPGTERNANKKCKKGKERIRLDQTNTYRCYLPREKPRTRNSRRSNRSRSKNNFTKPSR